VHEHAWLFVNGDVEGEPLQEVLARERIQATHRLDWSLQETAEWAVKLVRPALSLCGRADGAERMS
jgi:hypothetical protein